MRVLIADDEPPARRRLARMLDAVSGIEVVGEVSDGAALLARIEDVRPDVVFLDIRMPGVDGLSLVRRHPDLPPVVFVTAYDEYAVSAFEVDAIDYLVKPVRPERLLAAIERVRARREAAFAEDKAASHGPVRVASATRGEIELFDPAAITRFWASQKYTLFRFEGRECLTEESLSALERRLSPHGFVRVHRGELIRLDALRALRVCPDGHEAELSDGQCVRVSRRSVAHLKAALAATSATER